MAVSFYVNMEPLALQIAHESIDNMKEDVTDRDTPEYLDCTKVENNLKYGFIALNMMIIFIESFLNTVLRDCIGIDDERQLRDSFDEKISSICEHYGVSTQNIKDSACYKAFEDMRELRNELVHYKIRWEDQGLGVKDLTMAKGRSFREYFVKDFFAARLKCISESCGNFAKEIGLMINPNVEVIECDGKDGLTSFVYDGKIHQD